MSSPLAPPSALDEPLARIGPEVSAAVDEELRRQQSTLEMIASENFAPISVLQAPEFAERQQRTLDGARILAERLSAADCADAGIRVLTGGTDVHLVLVDLVRSELDGRQAEDRLHGVGITVNRNAVPDDPRPPMVTSGLRIGTPALATRGFGQSAFAEVADIIAATLRPDPDLAGLRSRCEALAGKHPLYPSL